MTKTDFQKWAAEMMQLSHPDPVFSRMIDDLRSDRYLDGVNDHDPHIQDYVIRIADAAKAFENAHAALYGYLLTHHSPKTS